MASAAVTTLFDDPTTGNDRVLKWYTVQEVAKKEGYYKGTKCKELCKAYVTQGTEGIKLEKRAYWIRGDKLELFKRPEEIPKQKKEAATSEGNRQHLSNPCKVQIVNQANQTTGSHETIIKETGENAKKPLPNIDVVKKHEKPEPELKENLHDPPKAKKPKRRKRRRSTTRTTPPKNIEPKNPKENFIKLNRRIKHWQHFREPFTRIVFEYLLLEASYMDSSLNGEKVKTGTVITSRSKIAEENGITVGQVRKALEKLISSEEIRILSTSKNPTKGTTIHVVNYAYWQCKETNQPAVERKADWNELTPEQREARAKEALESIGKPH